MPETISQLLHESANRFGPRSALLFKPGFRYLTWSYQQVWEGAGQVASLLQQQGVKKDDRVLIWAPNCPQWVLAFYGCARAGAIAVPLDMRSTREFIQQVTSKTEPSMAFVSRFTPTIHRQLEMPRVYLEELDALTYGLPAPKEVETSEGDIAEIMFTSGTTGDPKGVMLTHKNLLANLHSVQQILPGSESQRLLSILPLSHMFEQMGTLFMAMRAGANVTFATSRQPSLLFKLLQERRITMMLLVPQALDLFMKAIEREVSQRGKERTWRAMLGLARRLPLGTRRTLFREVHRQFGGCLTTIVSGGAPLDPEVGDKWGLLGVRVMQGYGATEASPGISSHPLNNPRFDSAGPPLPGVDVRIADDGEILVRGDNITPGYWEAPEQTASIFEGEWYKTGDLGFLDKEGCLHIRGRKKDMIVLANGQNVFPEDIESVLRNHPAVTDAVVVGLPGDSGVEVHAVLLMDAPEAAPEVVSWTNSQLAEHQQVRGFTVWPEPDFPRTHTLKVKKPLVIDALRGVTPSTPAVESGPRPADDSGAGIPRMVAELSGVPPDQVTPEKTLGADLNLDSLKRVELLSAIEQETGIYVDESLVGASTTVGELTELLESQREARAALPPFYRWPLTFWFGKLRELLHQAIMFPLLGVMYRAEPAGLENLDKLNGPALFAANHNAIQWDSLVLIKVTPRKWRHQLSFAAAAEITFGTRWLGALAALVANAFPLSRDTAIRASLEHMGRLMDGGWSVVIFPEGDQRVGKEMLPFQSGTGMLGVESRTPVVPVHLVSLSRRGPQWFPFRERVSVRFGAPLTFKPGTSYVDATNAIENAVRSL